MIQNVIARLLEKGWTYDSISLRTGIAVSKLKHANEMRESEENTLLRVAAVEARIDLDKCFEGDGK